MTEIKEARSSFVLKLAAIKLTIPKRTVRRSALTMPYSTNADLPPSVRNHLPPHAQDIYREAFNHAHAAHWGDPRREEAAHRIAWGAVMRSYEKVGGEWVARER